MFAERALSPSNRQKMGLVDHPLQIGSESVFDYKTPPMDANAYSRDLARYYEFKGGSNIYSTLPAKKTQYMLNELPERSVTPDITRGLVCRRYDSNKMGRNEQFTYGDVDEYAPRQVGYVQQHHPNFGIPVQMPNMPNRFEVPSSQGTYEKKLQGINPNESLKISPIDPRHSGGFHSSTPAAKNQELKSAVNLGNILLSPKKSTMSNEELYAVIHKGKKKMNIKNEEIDRGSPVLSVNSLTPVNSDGSLNKINPIKSPETGYLGDKSRTRTSWSPKSGEYMEFTNTNIDKIPQSSESRSRLSWACNDRKGTQKTSTLDFKKLLLQVNSKPTPASPSSKKVSAVERLKLSKEQIQPTPKPAEQEMNILELSRSPRSIGNRKLITSTPSSPRSAPDKARSVPKLLSPRSQWRFANPRSDVLSSTILEDCREDESPNSSAERKYRKQISGTFENNIQSCIDTSNAATENKEATGPKRYMTVSERLQAQRAQFFNSGLDDKYNNFSSRIESGNANDKPTLPTLETAF